MSCFQLTDLHVSTIAARIGFLYSWDFETTKDFADRMKKVNIDSVNQRYNQIAPKRGVNANLFKVIYKAVTLTDNDIASMIVCWNYQSDNAKSLDYRLIRDFLFSTIDRMEWCSNKSNVWAI